MKRGYLLSGLQFFVFFLCAGDEDVRGFISSQGSSSAVMTINRSGVYPLISNYSGEVLITANDVTLDLQGFTINGGTRGVRVTSNNVTIQNGTIRGAGVGVRIQGNNNNLINLDLIANGTGVEIVGNANTVIDCSALSNTTAGFSLSSAQRNSFYNCQAIDNGGSGYGYGYVSTNGISNYFENCLAQRAFTSASSPIYAAGFAFLGTEQESTLIDCYAQLTQGSIGYGIYLASTTSNNSVRKNYALSVQSIGIYDEAGGSSSNQVYSNIASNNGTNFSIGSQYPISAAKSKKVGTTANVDADLPAFIDCDTVVGFNSAISFSDNTNYCLANQFSGQLTLSKLENVSIDLNGYSVGNITIDQCTNVSVYNGFITDAERNGIDLTDSNQIFIESVCISNASLNGISMASLCSDVFFKNIQIISSALRGVDIQAGDALVFERCLITNNSTEGVYFGGDGSGQRCRFVSCVFNNNGSYGAQIASREVASFLYCHAVENKDTGFYTEGFSNSFYQCASYNNVNNGYYLLSGVGNLVRECVAGANGQFGFSSDNRRNNVVGACYAYKNSAGDYDNIEWANASASTGDQQYWVNILQ